MRPRNRFEVEGERMSRKLAALLSTSRLRFAASIYWLAGCFRGLA